MAKPTKVDRQIWLNTNIVKSRKSIETLLSAKKQQSSDFDDRIRAMNRFYHQLMIQLDDNSQDELFDADAVLTPELVKLLEAPLHGLD